MGEPLANYNSVMTAVRRINTELGIGARHITISTVGLVPRIQRLAQEDIQVSGSSAYYYSSSVSVYVSV
jgi:23S rRNA (adenine2503-C2)-methyltransferase